MQGIHWVVQTNLTNLKNLQAIKETLSGDGISFEEVKVIPFSDELPEIKNSGRVTVFYGSTTLILNASKDHRFKKGIFYNSSNFSVKNYLEKWGDRMLNSDTDILTFVQIAGQKWRKERHWFVRPVADDKAFSGRVMSFDEMVRFERELNDSNNPYLTPETLIAISTPKQIEKEWRHFIVDKKIVSSCRYTKNGKVDISAIDIPREVLTFAAECCTVYTPHDIFVMDTALYQGRNHIVECNCFNDTGFYDHDINSVVKAVNVYLKAKISLGDEEKGSL